LHPGQPPRRRPLRRARPPDPVGFPPSPPDQAPAGTVPLMAVADSSVVAVLEEAPVREAGLWSDAWRQLRRNPLFLGPAVVMAGFYGGIVDTLIARVTDVWFALPTFLGAIVVLSVLGGNGLPQLTLVLVLFGWPTMTRLMRSAVLTVRDLEYVTAARALGAGDLRLMVRHVLPNALAPVIVYGAIRVGIVIAAEATLSFLGLGLQLPAIS